MSRRWKGILGKSAVTSEEIRQAMGEGISEALREHKRAGVPVATMRDGKVVLVPPEEIVVPESDDDDEPSHSAEND